MNFPLLLENFSQLSFSSEITKIKVFQGFSLDKANMIVKLCRLFYLMLYWWLWVHVRSLKGWAWESHVMSNVCRLIIIFFEVNLSIFLIGFFEIVKKHSSVDIKYSDTRQTWELDKWQLSEFTWHVTSYSYCMVMVFTFWGE